MVSEQLKKQLILSLILFGAFIVFTFTISHADVQTVPAISAETLHETDETEEVGMATLNLSVAEKISYHKSMVTVSKVLGIVAILLAVFFMALAVLEMIARKSVLKADKDLYVLAAFYLAVLLLYIAFDFLALNYRPVLLKEELEPSYPSTHTLIGICVFATSAMQFKNRIPQKAVNHTAVIFCLVCLAAIVITRFLSGVHWFTDIIGGILLSAFLISLYMIGIDLVKNKKEK